MLSPVLFTLMAWYVETFTLADRIPDGAGTYAPGYQNALQW